MMQHMLWTRRTALQALGGIGADRSTKHPDTLLTVIITSSILVFRSRKILACCWAETVTRPWMTTSSFSADSASSGT
jgi:hypothetical protein